MVDLTYKNYWVLVRAYRRGQYGLIESIKLMAMMDDKPGRKAQGFIEALRRTK